MISDHLVLKESNGPMLFSRYCTKPLNYLRDLRQFLNFSGINVLVAQVWGLVAQAWGSCAPGQTPALAPLHVHQALVQNQGMCIWVRRCPHTADRELVLLSKGLGVPLRGCFRGSRWKWLHVILRLRRVLHVLCSNMMYTVECVMLNTIYSAYCMLWLYSYYALRIPYKYRGCNYLLDYNFTYMVEMYICFFNVENCFKNIISILYTLTAFS